METRPTRGVCRAQDLDPPHPGYKKEVGVRRPQAQGRVWEQVLGSHRGEKKKWRKEGRKGGMEVKGGERVEIGEERKEEGGRRYEWREDERKRRERRGKRRG